MSGNILSDYFTAAMTRALYERLEDGDYAGRIPELVGVVAFGKKQRECEEALRSVLEDWVLVGLKKGHELPVLEGIDLNKEIAIAPLETM